MVRCLLLIVVIDIYLFKIASLCAFVAPDAIFVELAVALIDAIGALLLRCYVIFSHCPSPFVIIECLMPMVPSVIATAMVVRISMRSACSSRSVVSISGYVLLTYPVVLSLLVTLMIVVIISVFYVYRHRHGWQGCLPRHLAWLILNYCYLVSFSH